MCWLSGCSRASYYRTLREQDPGEEDMAVRAAIQQAALLHRRRYGYRRITAELRRRGLLVNHKRVARLMREDNLLAIRHRKFILTTSSTHDLPIHLNLAKRLDLTGPDQLWVADLTYIRLHREWVYLAVILDRWSRRVIGWALDRTLATRLPLAALQAAIQNRHPQPGLVHHSDRGVQYASAEYVGLLERHHITPSMSAPANPYDNACCESFMKTLKQEEIHCRQYRDLEDLERHLEEFIDVYYNQQRLHSALGYLTPTEFEQKHPVPSSAPRIRYFQPPLNPPAG
jgi:putative transposase